MTIMLRPARREDAPAIARLHVETWHETYRGLAPEAVIRAVDEPMRLARWEGILAADAGRQTVLLAEEGGALAGFGLVGEPTDAALGPRAEVKYLYVGKAFKRRGIGRLLLAGLAREALALGHDGFALGVVVGNDPAIAFYEALGGQRVGHYRDPGPLWRSDNLIYAWDDLRRLTGDAPTIHSASAAIS